MAEAKVTVTARIPEELFEDAQSEAEKQGVSLTQLIITALETFLYGDDDDDQDEQDEED